MPEPMAVSAHQNYVRRERISSLLGRYPELLGDELDELIVFYKTAPPLETALLTCEEEIAAKSQQFLHDHAKATSRGLEAPLVLLILALFSVAIMIAIALHLSA